MGAVWKRMSWSFVVHDPGEGDTPADNRNKYHSLIKEQWKERWKTKKYCEHKEGEDHRIWQPTY